MVHLNLSNGTVLNSNDNSGIISVAGPIVAIGMLINLAAFAYVVRSPKIKRPLKVTLFNLIGSDCLLLFGMLARFIQILYHDTSPWLCSLISLTLVVPTPITCTAILGLATYNFLAVHKATRLSSTVTTRRVAVATLVSWTLFFSVGAVSLAATTRKFDTQCLLLAQAPPGVLELFSVYSLVCSCGMVVLNIGVAVKLRSMRFVGSVYHKNVPITSKETAESTVPADGSDICHSASLPNYIPDVPSPTTSDISGYVAGSVAEQADSNHSLPRLKHVRGLSLNDLPRNGTNSEPIMTFLSPKSSNLLEIPGQNIPSSDLKPFRDRHSGKVEISDSSLRSASNGRHSTFAVLSYVSSASSTSTPEPARKDTAENKGGKKDCSNSVSRISQISPGFTSHPDTGSILTFVSTSQPSIASGSHVRSCPNINSLHDQHKDQRTTLSSNSVTPRMRATIITLTILAFWNTLLNLPMLCLWLWLATQDDILHHPAFPGVSNFLAIIVPFNSLTNPFLYAWRFVEWKKLYHGCCRRRQLTFTHKRRRRL